MRPLAQGLRGKIFDTPITSNVCLLCRYNVKPKSFSTTQRRHITQNWLRKTAEAKAAWDDQAVEIRGGNKRSMMSILVERGYINDCSPSQNRVESLMTEKRIGAYVGVDPTAPSMHVGHLVPLMCLFWLYVHGFHAVTLVGGSTAQVGDPTDRTTSREKLDRATRKINMVSIHYQLKVMWANMEVHARFKHNYQYEWIWHRELVNNNTWLSKVSIIEFMKLVGNATRLGTMLGRHKVRTSEGTGEGMSYAEFSYPLLQAWDWWHMYSTKGIQMQIGGSDQFGNISAGIDAVDWIRKNHHDPLLRQEDESPLMKPVGFTTPLLTAASGEKLGKSAGNAVWLDKDKTTPYELYQYFLRTADVDVERYLCLLTFIPMPEIKSLMQENDKDRSKRLAQRRLAFEVLSVIHGEKDAKTAESQSQTIFGSGTSTPSSSKDEPMETTSGDWSSAVNKFAAHVTAADRPTANMTLPWSLVVNQPIARVLYAAKLVSSRSEGHRIVIERGAYIGSLPGQKGGMGDKLEFNRIVNWNPAETEKFIIDGSLLILRVGKWNVRLIKIVGDEEFDAMSGDAPGWEEFKEGRRVFSDEEEMKEMEAGKNEQFHAQTRLWAQRGREGARGRGEGGDTGISRKVEGGLRVRRV